MRRPQSRDRSFAELADGFVGYSELADILVFARETLGTSFPLSSYGDWLLDQSRGIRRGMSVWAAVESEIPARLESQIAAMSGGQSASTSVEPLQVQLLVAEAIATGARSVVFGLTLAPRPPGRGTRLRGDPANDESPAAADRALGCRRAALRRMSRSRTRTRASASWRPNAQMLVITQHAPVQQFVAGPWRPRPTILSAVRSAVTDQAFLIGPSRLEPLRGERASGMRIATGRIGTVSYAPLTQEPLAINHLRRKLSENAQRLRCVAAAAHFALMAQTGEDGPPDDSRRARTPASPAVAESAQHGIRTDRENCCNRADVDNACRVSG